jgi:hypothetical protein
MKFKNAPSFFTTTWKYFLLVPFVSILSCVQQNNHHQPGSALPKGKWEITRLKDAEKLIVLDTSRVYFLVITSDNNLKVTAEDNQLSGDIAPVDAESFTVQNITITDVCCNSDTAKMLFRFFGDIIRYHLSERKLTMSSQVTLIELEQR